MKEWIIDLYPIGGGFKTQTRLSAANQSAASFLPENFILHTGLEA